MKSALVGPYGLGKGMQAESQDTAKGCRLKGIEFERDACSQAQSGTRSKARSLYYRILRTSLVLACDVDREHLHLGVRTGQGGVLATAAVEHARHRQWTHGKGSISAMRAVEHTGWNTQDTGTHRDKAVSLARRQWTHRANRRCLQPRRPWKHRAKGSVVHRFSRAVAAVGLGGVDREDHCEHAREGWCDYRATNAKEMMHPLSTMRVCHLFGPAGRGWA